MLNTFGKLEHLNILEGVRNGCSGESLAVLEEICDQLPQENCLPANDSRDSRCKESEFDCGDGQCIPGIQTCDYKFHCKSGADENNW